jgi:hypothetical protein
MSNGMDYLRKALLSGDPSLSDLLSQAKCMADRLIPGRVPAWIDLELNGYHEEMDLPSYRKILSDRLEVYHAARGIWQFAGNLNYALEIREPLARIEELSRAGNVPFGVPKAFSIKNYFGDSFASDWPQRFVIEPLQYRSIINAVTERLFGELEVRGLAVCDTPKFLSFMRDVGQVENSEVEKRSV